MVRKLLIGAAVLLLAGGAAPPAQAQAQDRAEQRERVRTEMGRLHGLCDQGYKPACIRFGVMLGRQQERATQWRRSHPEWWWWEPWIERDQRGR